MSGFSGGSGNALSDLIRQVQGQQGQTPATQPSAQPQGVGPGEPQSQYTGAYNQQGMYNTLATDMSRGRMGPWGFGGNQFNYTPFGNPYAQPQSGFGQGFGGPGPFGQGGYGGGWGGPPTPIMPGQNIMGGGMVGNHQFTGRMGGYGGTPQWGGYGGFGGGFNRRMF